MNAISSGEGVPVPLLARFVKYCLIKKKNADMNLEALKKVHMCDIIQYISLGGLYIVVYRICYMYKVIGAWYYKNVMLACGSILFEGS